MINDLVLKIFEYAPSPTHAFDNADQDNANQSNDDNQIQRRKDKYVKKRRMPFDLDADEARAYRNRSVPDSTLPDWHVPHTNRRNSEE